MNHSRLLLEIVVEELISFIDCNEFSICSQFADVFSIYLKDAYRNKKRFTKNNSVKKSKKTFHARHLKTFGKHKNQPVTQKGQVSFVIKNVEELISKMKMYPIEIALSDRHNLQNILGSTQVPWNEKFIDYLKEMHTKVEPMSISEIYNVFDEYTSRRMAAIKLNIKLNNITDQIDATKLSSAVCANTEEANWLENTGTIKTIYNHGICKLKDSRVRTFSTMKEVNTIKNIPPHVDDERKREKNINLSDYLRSQTDLKTNKKIAIVRSKSCSSITKEQINILDYIFGDNNRSLGNQVYCVGYCTVENNARGSDSSKPSTKEGSGSKNNSPSGGSSGVLSSNLLISTRECKNLGCIHKDHDRKIEKPDDRILIDLKNAQKHTTSKIEEVVGGMKAKMKVGDHDSCFCECECKFGFVKRTTYCNICGGYEVTGEDISKRASPDALYPCPIYHKLDKKIKAQSISGNELKKGKRGAADKSAESEKEKKGKKKKKDDRFKFNYGYTGIPPQIGHSRCTFPCTGTLGNVPKNMGWLWTADNIPGLKFRPLWKPGAANKYVVRMLRIAKNPNEIISKKKRKDVTVKKPLKRPLLVVHKKDGEYTVTMETCKQYSRPRAINQQPYEDKPLVTYTIGRTEEENLERQRKKERARRRLERDQREFIQSAFRDMCQEICLKTYQQALGILPDAESPECPCYPAEPGPDQTDLDHSCSCSEDKDMTSSDTDDDEWIVEFTPPNATFYPNLKTKKIVTVDNSSQYTYLDYRVKLLDRLGNPVPRFFKGPDGKQQCSDLGGFWSPDHKWIEINVDGYIAPDGKWAPNIFTGPNGELVDCENGKFQAANGNWLVVGIDGYIDSQGKWRYYSKAKVASLHKPKANKDTTNKATEKAVHVQRPVSEATWSCLGFASPKLLSKMGIVGHGMDKKMLLTKLNDMLARGEDVKLPAPPYVPRHLHSAKHKAKGHDRDNNAFGSRTFYEERTKCRHPVPSEKGVMRDARGRKTYFRLKEYKNKRPQERIADLTEKGLSLSSFHQPCFHSFISTETMKKELNDRLRAKYGKKEDSRTATRKNTMATQV